MIERILITIPFVVACGVFTAWAAWYFEWGTPVAYGLLGGAAMGARWAIDIWYGDE